MNFVFDYVVCQLCACDKPSCTIGVWSDYTLCLHLGIIS